MRRVLRIGDDNLLVASKNKMIICQPGTRCTGTGIRPEAYAATRKLEAASSAVFINLAEE
jgi:hypothetical protein